MFIHTSPFPISPPHLTIRAYEFNQEGMSKVGISRVVYTEGGKVTLDRYNIKICTRERNELSYARYEYLSLERELLVELRDAITAELNEPL